MKEHVIYCTDVKYEDGIISATMTWIHSGKVYLYYYMSDLM